MTPEEGLMIKELADAAGVSVRTIRYYIAEGLLPAPASSGRYARYSEDTLLLLRLIQQLKDAFLPLAEIRRRVSGLDPDEIRAALDELQSAGTPNVLRSLPDPGIQSRIDAGIDFSRMPSAAAPSDGASGAVEAKTDDETEPILYSIHPSIAPSEHRAAPSTEEQDSAADPAEMPKWMKEFIAHANHQPEAEDTREYIRRIREEAQRYVPKKFAPQDLPLQRLPSNLNRRPNSSRPENWRRIRVSDEVELHLREPVPPAVEQKLEALLAQIAQLLKSS